MPVGYVRHCAHSEQGVCTSCVIKMVSICINTTVDYQCKRKCIHDDTAAEFCSLKLLELHLRNLRDSMLRTIGGRTSSREVVRTTSTPRGMCNDAIQTVLDQIVETTEDPGQIHDRIDGLRTLLPQQVVNAIHARAVLQCHTYLFHPLFFYYLNIFKRKTLSFLHLPDNLYNFQDMFSTYFRRAEMFLENKSKLRYLPYRRRY
ncbi:hypothetical protein EGW08_017503 [Elysia chlorotica]|uniref:Uncharacterized protein n=1 Tax=Elysia chlorotica TaxID=188477 RepID=A0A433SZJ1_ELYCH|nr:hypothetical protein EGW08_017503 [Elysia chlorotica]